MSVYLQFDSLARSNPFVFTGDKNAVGKWNPNDCRYATQNYQTPTNYSVYYRDLNNCNNIRTIGRQHQCQDRLENLTYSVEFCSLTLPACTRVKRPDGTVVNIADEPYIYIRVMPIENSEGTLISTNNIKGGDDANFIAYQDRFLIGTPQNNALNQPPSIPSIQNCNCLNLPAPSSEGTPTWDCDAPAIVPSEGEYGYTKYRWIIFRSCMIMTMRLNLCSEQWQIRYTDRYGNDLILLEDAIDVDGTINNPPLPNPDLQTSILLGITPNYPVK